MTTPTNQPLTTTVVKPRIWRTIFTRQRFAYIGWIASILMVGIGTAFAFGLWYGVTAGGLMLAVFSWLLGNDE